MANMSQPNVDKRVKTEDVTNTKGLTFKSFGLSEEIQFVSPNFWKLSQNLAYLESEFIPFGSN